MSTKQRIDGGLLAGGLVLAALGQFYLTYRREYVWDGVLLWLVAVLLLATALVRVRSRERGTSVSASRVVQRWVMAMQAHPVRTVMALGGCWLSLSAGWLARQRPPDLSFAGPSVTWAMGVIIFLAAFLPESSTPAATWRLVKDGKPGRWLKEHRAEVLGLTLLVLAALIARVYNLEHIPANLGGDEGTQGAEALELLGPPLGNPFSTGWFSVPTMSFLAYGLAMRVFGATVGGLRTLSALIGTATVVTTFLLGQELWGSRVAWLSAIALGSAHYHIHFSRLGSNQIGDALIVTLTLYLLTRGLRTKRPMTFALAGAVTGLGWYGYFGARLVCVIVAGYLALQMLVRHRFWARHGRLLIILAAAAVVVAAPLLLHYLAHPEDVVSRPNQVSIFASGWLAREREITGRSSASLLLEQFWKSISAFNYTLDPTFWYRSPIPLLDLISGVFFVVGLIWATAHCRWPASTLLLIWFWLAILTGWVMTENPPSSQRMLIVTPALALFVGLGIDWTLRRVKRLAAGPDWMRRAVSTALLTAIAGLNLSYYFLVYTPSRVYGNPTAEMTTALARRLDTLGGSYPVYFHGAPFVYWDFGTLRFMASDVAGTDVPPPGEGPQPEVDLARGARFVFHPDRLDEMETIRQRYPGGVEDHVHSSADGELLYAMYEVGG